MPSIGQRLRGIATGSVVRRRILYGLAGGAAGYLYYALIGCATGTCPISSNPYISTLYGAAVGILLTVGSKGGTHERS